jgi:hypothetical protein
MRMRVWRACVSKVGMAGVSVLDAALGRGGGCAASVAPESALSDAASAAGEAAGAAAVQSLAVRMTVSRM